MEPRIQYAQQAVRIGKGTLIRSKRGSWFFVLLAVPLLALACTDDTQEPVPAPRAPDREAPSVATPATADEELLASMMLTPDEVSEVFPGPTWTLFTQPTGLSEEQPSRGQLASWFAVYEPRPVEGVFDITLSLQLFEAADGASVQFLNNSQAAQEVGPGVEIEQFDAGGIGDEAHGQVNRTPEVYTLALFRVNRVLVEISLPLGLSDEDRHAEALQLAQKVAEKIEAVIRG